MTILRKIKTNLRIFVNTDPGPLFLDILIQMLIIILITVLENRVLLAMNYDYKKFFKIF